MSKRTMASSLLFLLASAVLLAHSVTVCANSISQSNTTPSLSLCNNEDINDIVSAAIQELTEDVKESINTTVRDIVTELLSPLMSQVLHLVQQLGRSSSHPATSCKEILELAPSSTSGLYWIRSSDHSAKHMYCDMERSCKGVGGGWMRLASIDMRDSSHQCPHGLRTLQQPRRLCAMNIDSAGIHTVPIMLFS